jgi:hypothetical protein
MKKYFIIIMLFIISFSAFSKAYVNEIEQPPNPVDSIMINFINSINLDNYLNKPLDSLLSIIPFQIQQTSFVTTMKCKIRRVYVRYSDAVTLVIWVDNYQFMNPVNCRAEFDFSLFKRENLSTVILEKNYKTIKIASIN